MVKLKRRYKISILAAGVSLLGFVSMGLWSPHSGETPDLKLVVKDFAAGTKVDYEILSDGDVIDQGQKILAADNDLSLPLPDGILSEDSKLINYKLRIDSPVYDTEESLGSEAIQAKAVETLDLLMGLNRESGDISVSGSGLGSFEDVLVKNGDETTSITSDWAGLFSSNKLNDRVDDSQQDNNEIELAFQNFGLVSDADYLGSGSIVLVDAAPFGDSSGSSAAAVQARYVWALAAMAEQLSAVMVLQTEAIGMFFDARIQMKTQRKHQELRARANKDYHPSKQMCRIGSFMKSVAHADSQGEINKHVLNKVMMNQYMATPGSSASHGLQANSMTKLNDYINYHCDPRDNNGSIATLCPVTPGPPTQAEEMERRNKDIDYTRTLGNKLTVDVNFAGGPDAVADGLLDEEADIIALAKNLYFPNIFEMPEEEDTEVDPRAHYDSRSFAAKMNVAHSSFINIVGMKSRAHEEIDIATPESSAGWAHMKAMLREFGISDDDIEEILGARPSYYAQMEVLTKKIYQHPDFYTNLYDKPANVDRIGASLDAISLMNQRDRFESILRREMLTSLLIEEELAKHSEAVNTILFEEIRKPQTK